MNATPVFLKKLILTALLTSPLLLTGCGGAGDSQDQDPVVVDHPIAYVKRPVPVEDMNGQTVIANVDVRVTQVFQVGGDLFLRDRASPSADERNITASVTGGQGDVRDVSVSFDGEKLLFSLHLPEIENADPEDQPTWNIWEYNITEDRLHRIIPSDITAEEGQDRFPHFLPDGRIVFSSTRQRQAKARLLDEGKPQYAAMEDAVDEPAMVLHVMNDDGSEIKQISFNRSHDYAPTVLDNGQIAFSRWENADGRDAITLYRMNPDGTELELLYGAYSHDTGSNGSEVQFMRPQDMPDGQVMVQLMPFEGSQEGGDLVLIDVGNFVENDQPTWINLGLSGPAQTAATNLPVVTDGQPSAGGRFRSVFPLWDGTDRLLVSWSQCRLLEGDVIVTCTAERLADPAAVEAPPLYGIFVYDMENGTQLPIVVPEEGVIYTDLVAAQARALPGILYDKEATGQMDPQLVQEGVGVLHIHSIYDMDGADAATLADATPSSIPALADPASTVADQRPGRFLRIVKQVTLPDDDVLDFSNSAFGRTRAFGMREVVGYAPIEPDGSVMVKVPADVPLTFSVLDANGRRVGQPHSYSLQFRPGELVECGGCHDPVNNNLPHGRLKAAPPPANLGGPGGGLPFPNSDMALWTNLGETMAETRSRLQCTGACAPTMDIVFTDHWTDVAVRAKDADIAFLYGDLNTLAPVSNSTCVGTWTGLCRSIIHYEQHIHPMWNLERPVLDAMGVEIDNHRCTQCHNDKDAADMTVVPEGQLDLSDGPSNDEPEHFAAYRELLFADDEQFVNAGGVLADVQVQATDANGDPLFLLDANGDQVLDVDGNPIPILVTISAQGPSMRAGSANGGYFLSLFDAGGIHAGYLNDAEKKLIGEWLDIGAQYYNNPFEAPLDN